VQNVDTRFIGHAGALYEATGPRKTDGLITVLNSKASSVSGFREPSFADRQKAAQAARKNILDKFRSQPGPDDPAVKARQAKRESLAAARANVSLARQAAKAERDRVAQEAAAAQVVREKEEAAARQAAQKAARDARYAARKSKKK
jgi:hypothetical protein